MKSILFILLTSILLLSCFSKSATDYFLEGQEQLIAENYELAIKDMDQAISLKSDFAKAYFIRAEAYYNLKEYSRALEDYSSAIRFNPAYAVAYRFRGVVKVTQGDSIGAFNDWQKALGLGDERSNHYLRKYKQY
jgi:tetratricopeptide (TPR) repeat protein